MNLATVRRGLAATAVLAAIAAPSAMACHGPTTPPPSSPGQCASARSYSTPSGGHYRHHSGRDCTPAPPPVTPPPVTPPVDPPPPPTSL